VIWYGLDNPENSPFVPMYIGVNSVPESWVRLERDEYDEDSAWWAFASVDDMVNRYYGVLKPRVDEVKYPMQEHMFMMQEPTEKKALEIYETEGVEAAKTFLTRHTHSYMHWAESAYWDLAKKLRHWTNNNQVFEYYPEFPRVQDTDPYNQ
jgi:dipeptidase